MRYTSSNPEPAPSVPAIINAMADTVSSWISPKARKGSPSAIAGRGLSAIDAIRKSELVAVKGGHVVTTEELQALPESLANSDVQIADDLHLVALHEDEYEGIMLFMNHSCEPNVGIGGNVVFIVIRDIEPGDVGLEPTAVRMHLHPVSSLRAYQPHGTYPPVDTPRAPLVVVGIQTTDRAGG